MADPFSDLWAFVIGNTDDHNALGWWKYLFVVLFLALVVASVVIAWRNWQQDPSQRTRRNLAIWFVRMLVGGMWFQGMLWKLPLPVGDARGAGGPLGRARPLRQIAVRAEHAGADRECRNQE